VKFNKNLLRNVHRWLGLIAGVQLLLWTISGLYFSLIPIDEIHGDHLLTKEAIPLPVSRFQLVSPSDLILKYPEIKDATLENFRLSAVLGKPVYVVMQHRFDARTAEMLEPISRSEAIAIVAARTDIEILSAALISEVEPGNEFRGGDLPAWKVNIAEENASIYVSANSGRIRAVRNFSWRIFDFLWALHIMDYEDRDDFNNLLLKFMSGLAVITVASGLILFFVTQRWGSMR